WYSMDVDMARSPLLFDWRQTRRDSCHVHFLFATPGTHYPDEPTLSHARCHGNFILPLLREHFPRCSPEIRLTCSGTGKIRFTRRNRFWHIRAASDLPFGSADDRRIRRMDR
ncbi:MAG: hypothetical protein ABFD98_15995, partial [Syntrophobacteraceae bacterium]